MRMFWRGVAALACLFLVGVAAFGYRNATSAPVVRTLTVRSGDYPRGAKPIRILLFSDLHVHGPDMPPSRLGQIVQQMNLLRPDVAIIAGDFIGDNWIGRHYSATDAIYPLGQLKAPLGVYAVLGNNDYGASAGSVARALAAVGIHVLVNDAARVGPIALGGIDGRIPPQAPWAAIRQRTYRALENTRGVKVLVAHRPDEFRWAPASVTLVLAGHTHCGQLVLPLIGPLATGSDFGTKYLCGVVRAGPKTLVVTGGLGTSHVPLRIGAPADVWLISLEGVGGPIQQ